MNTMTRYTHINKNTALLLVSSGTDTDGAAAYTQAVNAIKDQLAPALRGAQIYDAIANSKLLRAMNRASRAGARFTSVQDALERIKTDGYMTTYVQPLFLTSGHDTDAMDEEIDARVSYGCFSSIYRGIPLPPSLRDLSSLPLFSCSPGSPDFASAAKAVTDALISTLHNAV